MTLICIDGCDGVGKTTQVSLLAERLRAEGRPVYQTKEPGGQNPLSQTIRQILLSPETTICPPASLCLFLADRCQNVLEVRKQLAAGAIVISDRSSYSSFVYYAAAMVEEGALEIAAQIAPLLDFAQPIKPDWCFVCNADFEWSRSQLKARNQLDRIEQLGDEFHQRTHEFFKPFYLSRLSTQMQNAPERTLHCLPASQHSKEQICDQIFDALNLTPVPSQR